CGASTCCGGSLVRGEVESGCGFCFFFFQAEDGIRDYKVTGVQTCALPIWWESNEHDGRARPAFRMGANIVAYATGKEPPRPRLRSEERRVGKEWRSRWSPCH